MTEPHVYIVSVWHLTGARPGFRATARLVEDADARSYTTVDELGRYLAKAGEAQPPQAAPVQLLPATEATPPRERTCR